MMNDLEKPPQFSSVFNTIMEGTTPLGKIVEGGASNFLLIFGILTLVGALALEGYTITDAEAAKTSVLPTQDLIVLILGSVVLLLAGSALRVWDRYMDDKGRERDVRLRVEAAEKAASVLKAAIRPPQQPGANNVNLTTASVMSANPLLKSAK